MSQSTLAAPQLVIDSRMIYSSWIPADPKAAAALLPDRLEPAGPIYMNQYVVDSAEQTSGFGAYSLTYLGLDLGNVMAPDGVTPGRFFTNYFNSSEIMREYVLERGVPATPGTTTVEVDGDRLVATTSVDGRPIIRTQARVGSEIGVVARGHLTYVTRIPQHGQGKGAEKLVAGNYAYIGDLVTPFELLSVEFLDQSHPVWAIRPKQPFEPVTGSCWFAPRDSFVYPGGEYEIKP
ncbi:MAG TPA: hypothetical protein VEG34_08965 [Thermoanaerobaculia bacterium]|nr:hypothetical protein [Thermoanaerobaculia bacterium]